MAECAAWCKDVPVEPDLGNTARKIREKGFERCFCKVTLGDARDKDGVSLRSSRVVRVDEPALTSVDEVHHLVADVPQDPHYKTIRYSQSSNG